MIKMKIFVHCDGWIDGGYENILYFPTSEDAEDWLVENPNCKKISLEEITEEEFAEDYIGTF